MFQFDDNLSFAAQILILPFYSQLRLENPFNSESLKPITYSKAEMSADRI